MMGHISVLDLFEFWTLNYKSMGQNFKTSERDNGCGSLLDCVIIVESLVKHQENPSERDNGCGSWHPKFYFCCMLHHETSTNFNISFLEG